MNFPQPNSESTQRSLNRERGFTMIELGVVIAIILIISAMAIFALQPSLQDAKYDNAMREVIDQLRQAREYAIANRRYVQVTFPIVVIAGQPTQYQVVTTQKNVAPYGPVDAGADIVLSTVPIQVPAQYFLFPGAPDTPDGFGNASPIEFEGLNGGPVLGMMFQSDGELVDGLTFLPINGTVFIGFPNAATASRAVTVLGGTGRIRGWKYTGTAWFQF
ncbi:MAG: type II secretion system protein [Candidatus Acidiferrales bacterium]